MKNVGVAILGTLAMLMSIEPSMRARNATAGTVQIGSDGTADTDARVANPVMRPIRTGQTNSFDKTDDGDLKNGTEWPNPRFTDNDDGTVTDNITGLVWLKDPYIYRHKNWSRSLVKCRKMRHGKKNLTDGSVEGDWRMPNLRELQSLIDYGQYDPALPPRHPFINVDIGHYFTSTIMAGRTQDVWTVRILDGAVVSNNKSGSGKVWPVRDAR